MDRTDLGDKRLAAAGGQRVDEILAAEEAGEARALLLPRIDRPNPTQLRIQLANLQGPSVVDDELDAGMDAERRPTSETRGRQDGHDRPT